MSERDHSETSPSDVGQARYTFWFMVIIGALILDALLTYGCIDALFSSRVAVLHSYDVLFSTEGIIQSADQIILSERAFLLSKDDSSLGAYASARDDIRKKISGLQKLTADSAVQQGNLNELSAAVEDEIAAVDLGIQHFRESGMQTIVPSMQKGMMEGKLGTIRSVMQKFKVEESRLLRLRRGKTIQNWQTMIVTISVLFCGLLLLLGWAFRLLRRDLQARQFNTALLEERVAERTVQLESANRELEAFAYSVSHDLRAPLRSISGFSEALIEDHSEHLAGEASDYLKRIVAASRKMGDLIDDLLNLSRVSRSELEKQPVNLSETAESIVQEIKKRQPAFEAVDIEIDPDLSVSGDARLLRIALTNLIDNAFKYSSRNPRPRIELRRAPAEGSRLAFLVKDNGVGFDMKYSAKLFSPFQRLHHVEDFSGTGIGLAIVQRIVVRHGGRVWAEGVVGEGAGFYFTL